MFTVTSICLAWGAFFRKLRGLALNFQDLFSFQDALNPSKRQDWRKLLLGLETIKYYCKNKPSSRRVILCYRICKYLKGSGQRWQRQQDINLSLKYFIIGFMTEDVKELSWWQLYFWNGIYRLKVNWCTQFSVWAIVVVIYVHTNTAFSSIHLIPKFRPKCITSL